MESKMKARSARKRRAIIEAATREFLDKGYDRTSMDDVATRAKVSKPTVYQHFANKERLFSAIVHATTDQLDTILAGPLSALTPLETDAQAETADVEKGLAEFARQLATAFMQPQLLRLRRLVIANANRFPDVRCIWHEQGWDRFIGALAGYLQRLADQGLLRLDDPLLATNHLIGMLLWMPMNKAMFGGDKCTSSEAEIERYAQTAAYAFLAGYGEPASPRVHRRNKRRFAPG